MATQSSPELMSVGSPGYLHVRRENVQGTCKTKKRELTMGKSVFSAILGDAITHNFVMVTTVSVVVAVTDEYKCNRVDRNS